MTRSLPFRRSRQGGRGLLSHIKKRIHSLFHAPLQASSRLQKTLSQMGSIPIGRLYVARTPVQSGVQKILQWMSLGKYEQVKAELRYDDVYHLYLIVQLVNGRLWKLEKNHIVELTPLSFFPPHAQTLSYIGMKNTQQLIQQAHIHHPSQLWSYDPQHNNCQHFVQMICSSNHLQPDHDLGKEYLRLQDADALLHSLPGFLPALPKLITDVASTGDRLIHGDGLHRHHRSYSRFLRRSHISSVDPSRGR